MVTTRIRKISLLLASLIVAIPLGAQENCPCVPLTKLWTSTLCESWNCASAALVTADGNPGVFAVPMGMNDKRWIVIRQSTAGAYSDNSPFSIETFDEIGAAGARFASFDRDHHPIIVSAPDGKLLILALKEPESRRRAVTH